MIKDITLGQFFPGNSVIHRLDPRINIILTIIYLNINLDHVVSVLCLVRNGIEE